MYCLKMEKFGFKLPTLFRDNSIIYYAYEHFIKAYNNFVL
ncbi:MAG: hypothetical protein KatS3mg034_1594 [Vicingaceae bacterium]|nr:MAG: hypothetical protein KatS3mg034_0293 [Vicingaceae bacterium]GIV41215.1 MAG: hypothetical protein KatS3mg034_0525 [Vicingaceae bacterium]GIV42284.1 MAG: hypothetical protein KatS3mg034_1594 [Vicingaceae bacterium]